MILCLSVGLSLFVIVKEISYLDGSIQRDNVALGGDFSNVWVGTRLALSGDLRSLFEPVAFNRAMSAMIPRDVLPYNNVWSYPPHMLLLVTPFALLEFVPAYVLWMASTMLLFVWAARRAAGGFPWWFLALLSPAALANIVPGQNGFLSAALMTGGFFLLKSRPVAAGILLGLLCFKPQMGLLVPVLLIVDRNWRAFIAAAVTVAIQLILVTASFGTEIWPLFLEHTVPLQTRYLEEGGGPLESNLTCFFMAARVMGLGLPGAYVSQAIALVVAVVGFVWVCRRTADLEVRFGALVAGTFLAAPYAAGYDLVPLALVVLLMARRGADEGLMGGDAAVLALAWCVPLVMALFVIYHVGFPLAPFVLALMFTQILRHGWRRRTM